MEENGSDDDRTDEYFTLRDETVCVAEDPIPMFVELQQLVPRVHGGLHFDESVFSSPVTAHFRVLWLETARWVNFEQNYNEVEQRFTEAHVSPMKFQRVIQLREQLRMHGVVLRTAACTMGQALDEVSQYARSCRCISSDAQYNVLRAILFAERWHPEIKGHISDVEEFNRYWADTISGTTNQAYEGEEPRGEGSQMERGQHRSQSMAINARHEFLLLRHRYNHALSHSLKDGSEACTVLCGSLEFLQKPIIMLVRSEHCIQGSCLSEVDIPVRFIFIYLGLASTDLMYDKLARIFAIMMGNAYFRACAQKAHTVDDILNATDIFMNDALVMPITPFASPEALAGMVRLMEAYKTEMYGGDRSGERVFMDFDAATQNEPSDLSDRLRRPTATDIAVFDGALSKAEVRLPSQRKVSRKKQFVENFCPPFIDFVRGIKPWAARMPSDYRDVFRKDNFEIVFGSVLFLYFVNMAPAITFGALLNNHVSPSFTVSLTLLSTGVALFLFTLLSGQPLGFIGITAPMFILETSIASVARSNGVDLTKLRFFVGVYCSVFGLLFVTFNVSVLANHIRRSLEEIFNTFIAFFFLLKSLFTMFRQIPSPPSDTSADTRLVFTQKLTIAGTTLFLAFLELQFCLFLAEVKQGTYFRRKVRKMLGSLNVPLGMLLIVGLDQIFFRNFNLPKVNIPPSNEVNVTHWFNMPDFRSLTNYSDTSPAMVHGMGIAFGLTLAVIIFTEVALNGITAMKNKAVKSNVFVADIIVMQVVFPVVCGVLGWPFFSGATVRTMSNLAALVKMDRAPAPGMPHRVVGTVEQRVSGMLVGILVALSVFLGSVLCYIPLAALYGMFLYMGVMGLRDLQFFKRVLALMKRRKHWEDWEYVRGLPSQHIMVFAAIQAGVIAILVSLNIVAEFTVATYAGIIFPAVIIIYGIIRETVLPKWTWLALYLHQLDRMYKLNPSPVALAKPLPRKSVQIPRNSIFVDELPNLEGKTSFKQVVLIPGRHSDDEGSEHEDGVVRRTWAT
ncbi:unnamed protein product [Calicophoron daubneyi]|uniref:Anion exchange protein n=1 Tax=Calicophoron daubneyi TaxID=300641 RepID=A0AAV2U088_CALDB